MRYNGMEFVSEEEAREYFEEDVKGFLSSTGFVVTNQSDVRSEATLETKVSLKKLVGAYVGNKVLYVADKGVTYLAVNAKKFDSEAAKNKAAAMSKKGTYSWQVLPV